MSDDNQLNEMLNILINKIEAVINDKTKQSFGSLEYLLEDVKKTRDERLYLNKGWFFKAPRWLGEYGNTKEEDDISAYTNKITLYIYERYRGGSEG
jgi:hypothetical protein